MATKQEKAIKSAVTRTKRLDRMREEKHILWFLVALIVILLWLLLAQHWGWWPYSRPKLGNAFYTNIGAYDAKPDTSASTSTKTTVTDTSGSGATETGGGNTGGGSGSGGGGGGGTTTPASSGLLDLAANVNVGDSKATVTTHANDLGQNCAVVVNATTNTSNLGKQEVCTYTQGDKIVTVTYLNDRVVSASKTGF